MSEQLRPWGNPTDTSHKPIATAAALPPELPPAERLSRSLHASFEFGGNGCGLMTGPWCEYRFAELEVYKLVVLRKSTRERAYPIPNSSQFALPTIEAPACFSKATTVASYGGLKPV